MGEKIPGAQLAAALVEVLDAGTALSETVEGYTMGVWAAGGRVMPEMPEGVQRWQATSKRLLTLITTAEETHHV